MGKGLETPDRVGGFSSLWGLSALRTWSSDSLNKGEANLYTGEEAASQELFVTGGSGRGTTVV